MIPDNYDIPDHLGGDTFDGFTAIVDLDNVAVDLTGATIVTSIRRHRVTGPLVDQFTNTAGN